MQPASLSYRYGAFLPAVEVGPISSALITVASPVRATRGLPFAARLPGPFGGAVGIGLSPHPDSLGLITPLTSPVQRRYRMDSYIIARGCEFVNSGFRDSCSGSHPGSAGCHVPPPPPRPIGANFRSCRSRGFGAMNSSAGPCARLTPLSRRPIPLPPSPRPRGRGRITDRGCWRAATPPASTPLYGFPRPRRGGGGARGGGTFGGEHAGVP